MRLLMLIYIFFNLHGVFARSANNKGQRYLLLAASACLIFTRHANARMLQHTYVRKSVCCIYTCHAYVYDMWLSCHALPTTPRDIRYATPLNAATRMQLE